MKTAVFYFSATGNTELVSQSLVDTLNGRGHKAELFRIDQNDGIPSDKAALLTAVDSCDIIGVAFPILGGGAPGNVTEFVKKLPSSNNKPVFIYKTAADFVLLNHTASFGIIRRLKKKGYNVFYDRIFAMGSNWLMEYNHSFVKQLYSVIPQKIEHMVGELESGKQRLYKTPRWLYPLCAVMKFFEEEFGARLFGLTLHAADSCTQCGLCVNNCPVGNITDIGTDKGKIRFGTNCIMCMRCVYSCPANAIRSRGMGYCILKNGYDIKKIVSTSYENEEYVKADTKGYMKHFYSYLKDESM